MNIAVLAKWIYQQPLEYFLAKALDSLGHNVVCGNIGVKDMDISLVVKEVKFDLRHLSGLKILYYPDSTQRACEFFSSIQKHFDFIFLAHNEGIIDNRRIFYLPLGFDPDIHTPYPQPLREIFDITFVGTYRPEREFIRTIPNIKIYGNGWGDPIQEIYKDSLIKLNTYSKIILNHHYTHDTTNMRLYEVLAQKRFMLTDKAGEFKDGEDLVVYTSHDDLLEKIQFYLLHPDERHRIAENGYNSVQKHSYKSRMETMIKIIEEYT